MLFILLMTVGCLLMPLPVRAQSLVSLQDGRLVYNTYANKGQQNSVNKIPDFSNAGYKGGGIKIPELAVKETLEPFEGDCREMIQSAIDRVSALAPDENGHRGAVLLKAGIYPVEGSLNIRAGGVVLRGEGNGVDGTVLIATQKKQHDFIGIRGSGTGYGEVSGTRVKIASSYVATGTNTLDVEAGHSFKAGDNIVIQKTPNDAWIDVLDMRQYGWTATDYKTTFERKIIDVKGSILTLDIPVVDPIEEKYGGGVVFKSNVTGRISESGVENMRLESYFASASDESHGWNAIVLSRAENSWVRNVVAKYFGYSCVKITSYSRFNTVEDCAMIDPKSLTEGGRRYSFNLESNATGNLFQRCMAWGGRHDYVSGSRVPGPNVFLDCTADNTFSDIGPHHRWGTGQLYDNIYGGQIRVQNRGASGTGHGWAGAQILFWNCQSYKNDIEVESPPAAMNWGIGCVGLKQTNTGYWESWGTPVLPRSLYLQQLQERLGEQAVLEVTTSDQQNNELRSNLLARAKAIAAEPRVTYGIQVGDTSAFDITDNGGILTAQFVSNRLAEQSENIIDNDILTKYYQNGKKALWVQYQSVVPAIVTRYTITSGIDQEERDPLNWYLSASNDGTNWHTLDTRTSEDFPTRLLTRTFSFENTVPYLYYRLNITMNGNNNNTQFAEWELFQRKHQQISFGEMTEATFGDEPTELIIGATSGLPIKLEVVSGAATINNESYLTILGAGIIRLRATQEGDENYFPVSQEQTIEVSKSAQSISFAAITPKHKNETMRLAATSSSGLPVSYRIVSGNGSIVGNTLSFSSEGYVEIEAYQNGNDNYLPAEVVRQTLLVYAEDVKKDGVKIHVFPNPAHKQLKVKLDNKEDMEYTFIISDDKGGHIASSVLQKGNKTFEIDFDLGLVRNGYYYLYISNGTEVWVRIIVKQ